MDTEQLNNLTGPMSLLEYTIHILQDTDIGIGLIIILILLGIRYTVR